MGPLHVRRVTKWPHCGSELSAVGCQELRSGCLFVEAEDDLVLLGTQNFVDCQIAIVGINTPLHLGHVLHPAARRQGDVGPHVFANLRSG